MLSLQTHQLDTLADQRFTQRLAGLLQAHDASAQAVLDTREGKLALRQQVANARSHGLASELDIARYVITAWQLGEDFVERFGAMAEILGSTALTPSQRAEALEVVTVQVLAELQAGQTGGALK